MPTISPTAAPSTTHPTELPALLLRPAVDSRPEALDWPAPPQCADPVPPTQPSLRFEQEEEMLSGPPRPGRGPVTVDAEPSGSVTEEARAACERQALRWAPWFAQLLVEALEGRRSHDALGCWLDEWVLAEVSRRARLRRRERLRRAAPTPPLTVTSVRAQVASSEVMEVAAHLRRGQRSLACAFRLSRTGPRWRCVALELG